MTAMVMAGFPRPSTGVLASAVIAAGIGAGIGVALGGAAIGIAAIAGLAALAATVYAPGLILAAYLLIPFYKASVQGYSPIDVTVVLALLNALQAIPILFERRRRRISRLGLAFWMALPTLVLLGVLYGPDQSLALESAITFWALVVMPILPAALRVGSDPTYVRQFLWTFFAVAIFDVAVGLTALNDLDRLTVMGMNTIQMSRIALIVPLLTVAFVVPQGRASPVALVAILFVPIALVVAIASGSRGPLLALAIMATIWVVQRLLRARRENPAAAARILAGVMVCLFVVVLSFQLLPAAAVGRFSSLAEFVPSLVGDDQGQATSETSASARVALFGLAVRMFDDSPVLGTGTRGFEVLSPGESRTGTGDQYPHNAILQVAAEFGLVGLAMWLSVVLIGLFRRIPGGTVGSVVRVMFVFFVLNAMVSGDALSDRETLGLLALVLALDLPAILERSSAWWIRPARAPATQTSAPPPSEPEPAPDRPNLEPPLLVLDPAPQWPQPDPSAQGLASPPFRLSR